MHIPMKRNGVALLSMALSAVALMGCGTVRNLLSEHPKPYGGLAQDFTTVSSPDMKMPSFSQASQGSGKGAVFALGLILGLGATELCATGIADTLCLPYFYLRDGELFPYPYDRYSEDTPDCSSILPAIPSFSAADQIASPSDPSVPGPLDGLDLFRVGP
jgi:hypothetical protein